MPRHFPLEGGVLSNLLKKVHGQCFGQLSFSMAGFWLNFERIRGNTLPNPDLYTPDQHMYFIHKSMLLDICCVVSKLSIKQSRNVDLCLEKRLSRDHFAINSEEGQSTVAILRKI